MAEQSSCPSSHSERKQQSLASFKLYAVLMILSTFAFLGTFMAGFFLTKRELGLKSTCDVSHDSLVSFEW
jgi:MFS-type transporter involved in bile tolerance (Atg22 family)